MGSGKFQSCSGLQYRLLKIYLTTIQIAGRRVDCVCVLMIYCGLNNNTFKLFLIEHTVNW